MNSYIKMVFILSGLVFGASSAVAQSNFYVGAGGGQAEANELSFTDFDDGSGIAGSFDDSDFGWKVFGGKSPQLWTSLTRAKSSIAI